jgi:hypothetical protein
MAVVGRRYVNGSLFLIVRVLTPEQMSSLLPHPAACSAACSAATPYAATSPTAAHWGWQPPAGSRPKKKR